MPCPFGKGRLVVALKYHDRKSQPRYLQTSQHRIVARQGSGESPGGCHHRSRAGRRVFLEVTVESPAFIGLKNARAAIAESDVPQACKSQNPAEIFGGLEQSPSRRAGSLGGWRRGAPTVERRACPGVSLAAEKRRLGSDRLRAVATSLHRALSSVTLPNPPGNR